MNPKRYVIAIVAATLTLVSAMWLLAYWLQPVYGDLVRIGGHTERDYGWNLPMREFNPLAATWGGGRVTSGRWRSWCWVAPSPTRHVW